MWQAAGLYPPVWALSYLLQEARLGGEVTRGEEVKLVGFAVGSVEIAVRGEKRLESDDRSHC